jgi:peptidoglycan hydrolase-like protein with peptidoglycan-binding domain
MHARLVLVVVAALLAVGAGPAAAQTTPEPVPAAGAAKYKLDGGIAAKKMRYYARGQEVVLRGRVSPPVPGEVLTLYAVRGRKASKKVRRKVGLGGRFSFRFKVGGPGVIRLAVKHRRSAAQEAFRTPGHRITVVDWQAGSGERGLKVLLLQRGLVSEGYATPVTGYYDAGTARGVLAFRKANGMGRDGYASREVYGMLLRGRGAYKLRYPKAGKHVEFDWSRQVLVLARGAKPYRTYHTSSGAPATPTVFGSYRFYLQTPGTNSLGMVHSSYFIGGYAIHGYASVPPYPASHGCLRVPIPNAWSIFNWIDVGDRIFTYR